MPSCPDGTSQIDLSVAMLINSLFSLSHILCFTCLLIEEVFRCCVIYMKLTLAFWPACERRWFGLMAAGFACLLLGSSLSHAETVGYWRFGDDGGFLNDSGLNNHDLTMLPGDAGDAGDATQVTIPDSGPGSTFDDAIASNTQMAAYAPGSNFADGFIVDDHSDFSFTKFTIEALIHRPDANCDPGSCDDVNVWNVASQYNAREAAGGENDRSWKFQIHEVTNASGIPGHPKLTLGEPNPDGVTQTIKNVESDIFLDNDKDWYVAVSFDLSNQTDGVTFYVKNLTDGGPMQIDKKGHTVNVLYPTELLVPVVAGQDGDFDGDLDVDGADFLKWQRELGDATSLALWETNFGTTAAAATAASVPEPASVLHLGLGSLLIGGISRRRS